jgi:uncharacterized repeat protein (TIGR01451 family)
MDYTWRLGKTASSDVRLDSCAAAPTEPNVSYTVTYTKTADTGGAYAVSGTVTLGNPSTRTLTTDSISVEIVDGARTTDVATADQHLTLPAATNVGGTLVPGTRSTTFSTTLSAPLGSPVTATASATYRDPDDPSKDITALATGSTSVPLSVTDTPGVGATATISDHETITGTGVAFERTDPQPMSAFSTDDTFSTDPISGSGSFTIHKIVKATQPENATATLVNSVALTRSGEQTASATASAHPITITVTAANPTITVTKQLDLAPTSDATFDFTITSKDDTSKTWPASVTVKAGETSGQSSVVTVDPSTSGYTLTETPPDNGYTASRPTDLGPLGLCGSLVTDPVLNTRDLGHVTVVKHLSGPAAGAGTSFGFTVRCPGMDPIALQVDASSGNGTASTGDVIPTGVTCTATETGSPSGWTLTSTSPSDGSAVSGRGDQAGTVAFTNTRNLGHITVVKQLTGAVTATDTTFTFSVVCPDLSAMTLTIDPVHGASSASTPDVIPTGVVCTVTESAKDGWLLVATQPGSGTAAAGDGPDSTVTFVNAQRTGDLVIAKVVDKTSAAADSRLVYTLTVAATGTLARHGVVVTDTIPGHDPQLGSSWPTTYVNGSATCSTGCAATFDPASQRISWSVGDMVPPATVTLGFAVTIDGPAPVSIQHVDNAATVVAAALDPIRSNTVHTSIPAVEPFRVTRPPRLAYTGMPAGLAPLGLLLLATGLFLYRRARA